MTFPTIRQVVLDATDLRGLAEFYRQLFGLVYATGDEPPAPGEPDPMADDWLTLRSRDGAIGLAFQKVAEQVPTTWPDQRVPQQLHLDTTVADTDELQQVHERALALGARVLLDRTDDPDEPLWVYADPAGHPLCVFVG